MVMFSDEEDDGGDNLNDLLAGLDDSSPTKVYGKQASYGSSGSARRPTAKGFVTGELGLFEAHESTSSSGSSRSSRSRSASSQGSDGSEDQSGTGSESRSSEYSDSEILDLMNG